MTKEELESLKSSLRIEEVIGRYVGLARCGSNYKGLCPFHEDSHPSLSVSPAKQLFTCFACGETGDVFAFIQKVENCSFAVAVERFSKGATSCGRLRTVASLVNTQTKGLRKETKENAASKAAFLQQLLPYASGHTELSPAYLDFEVGQSPFMVPREWYGMRNRVIFPIRDADGVLVGFGARRINDSETDSPKYINSSASDGFDKANTLYGLYQAKAAIRETGMAFITEGYKDALAMHAAGFSNTVALCGTALTDGHIALLKKHTSHVCLLLDGDKAGREAACKILPVLAGAHIEAERVNLPDDEDPDSLFRTWGKKAFAGMIRKLLNKPHASESSLITACLLYPEAMYPYRGGSCSFAGLVYSTLEKDCLEFEDADHRSILKHVSEGGREDTLPPALQMVADGLHIEFDRTISSDLSVLSALLPEVENREAIYLGKLLFIYSEARLLRDIRRHVVQLLKLTSEENAKRTQYLFYIAARRELLRHVSECMERPGAV